MGEEESATEGTETGSRHMTNMPVVNLSGVRDRAEVAGLRISNVGAVLVPEDMPDLLSGATCTNVGAVIPVPAGTRTESSIGQLELPGATLAAGDPDTILLLVGQVLVSGEVPSVGYRGLVLVGLTLLPRAAQAVLAPKILQQVGQVVYYEGGANPRVITGDTRLSRGFFELVEQPLFLILIGDVTLAADVTPELLRAKVSGIVLVGDATLERADLEPLVQFLTQARAGDITVAAGDGASEA